MKKINNYQTKYTNLTKNNNMAREIILTKSTVYSAGVRRLVVWASRGRAKLRCGQVRPPATRWTLSCGHLVILGWGASQPHFTHTPPYSLFTW